MTRELACNLGLEPLLSFTVLAGGAMAVSAGAKELLRFGAAIALVEGDAASFRAASDDGIDDFAVSFGHRA